MKPSNKFLLICFVFFNAYAAKLEGCANVCDSILDTSLINYLKAKAINYDPRLDKSLLNKKINGKICVHSKKNQLIFVKLEQHGQRYIIEKHHNKWQKLILNPVAEESYNFVIRNSFSQSGIEAGVSNEIIRQSELMFKDRIRFNRDLHKGDTVRLLVSNKNSVPILLMASISHNSKPIIAMRFNSHGRSGFYDIKGHAMVDTFDRVPIKYKRISSPFRKSRMHPILGYSRPHNGVDLAANSGTPIHATSAGEIVSLGPLRGYGKAIIIKHHGNYQTLYAHMHGYAKGLKVGDHVSRKQIIGFVGMTGLATAPHCHYEFRVGNVPHDPMRVKLPVGEQLTGNRLKRFIATWKKRYKDLYNA